MFKLLAALFGPRDTSDSESSEACDSSSSHCSQSTVVNISVHEMLKTDHELQLLMTSIGSNYNDLRRVSTFDPMIVQQQVSSETMNREKPDKILLCFHRWKKFCKTRTKHVDRFCFRLQYDELMNQQHHDFIHVMMLLEMNASDKILPYEVADIIVNHVGRYWFLHKYFRVDLLRNRNAIQSMNVSYIFADYVWFTNVLDEIVIFNQGDERKSKSDVSQKDYKLSNILYQYTLLLIPPTIYSEYDGGDLKVNGRYIGNKHSKLWCWCLFHKLQPYSVSKIQSGYMLMFKFDVCIVGYGAI